MPEIRRDSKGRRLLNGENQRKDGKYEYKYQDVDGSRKSVYSWKLTPSDRTPAGKRDDISLREKEKEIQKKIEMGISTIDGKKTVIEWAERYLEQKQNIRKRTKTNYQAFYKYLRDSSIAYRQIDSIRPSDVKTMLIKMKEARNLSYETMRSIYGFTKQVFKLAVDEDVILKNPANFKLSSVFANDTVPRAAYTLEEQSRLFAFIKDHPHYKKYYDPFYILLHTGLRISEFSGLTMDEIDMENECIIIKHQLDAKDRGTVPHFVAPKTEHGKRTIPMFPGVKEAIQRILSQNRHMAADGCRDLLFITKQGNIVNIENWEEKMRNVRKVYNENHEEQLPRLTPHIFRHTFCTNMINAGMNPKILQYIMGHSNIQTTLNIYAHANKENVEEEARRISSIIRSQFTTDFTTNDGKNTTEL